MGSFKYSKKYTIMKLDTYIITVFLLFIVLFNLASASVLAAYGQHLHRLANPQHVKV
jgi:hypothetical protein